MYLRHTTRRKNGKVRRYWCLVRSVRVGRRVIQQTVAHLGELDEQGRVEARALSRRLIGAPEQSALFDDAHDQIPATMPVRVRAIDPFNDPEENRPPIFNSRNFAPRLPISA